MSYSARRLNKLADGLKASNYLEIGVNQGITFKAVKIEAKTGVDPSFQFDRHEYDQDDNIILAEVTSDVFFKTLPKDTLYDVVFVDGLHTFDQTYRDILNALRHTHSRSVLLVDDTIPNDVFSSSRDMLECLRLRAYQNSENKDRSWHGDTYKILPLLMLFNTNLDYRTITGGENHQTLIWKKSTDHPVDSALLDKAYQAVHNLSNSDYLWLLNNIDIYKFATEDEVVETAFSDLGIHAIPGSS